MLRIFAHIISVLFHPLLMVTYMLILLLLINPYLFGVNNLFGRLDLVFLIFLSTFVIPGFAVLMMRTLGMVNSLQLETKQERIGPYIATGIFYLWIVRNFWDNPDIPTAYTGFVLGATMGLFIAFFLNLFSKISAHAVGMGGLLGMVLITMWLFSYGVFTVNLGSWGSFPMRMSTVLMLTILLCGLVGTSRLLLQAHEPRDLYGGYLVGLTTQFIALRFLF